MPGGGTDEIAEERMGPIWPALELGVGLCRDEPRVIAELDVLDQPPVG